MEVGPGGADQVHRLRHLAVAGHLLGMVLGVCRLDTVESHGTESPQLERLDLRRSRVGQRRDSTGPPDHRHGILGGETEPPDVARPPVPEEPVEGFPDRGDGSRLHHGPGDVRSPDGLPPAAGDDGLLGHRHPVLGEQPHNPPDPAATVVGQHVLEVVQFRMDRVDEVPEDVDLPLVEQRRELDPGNEPDVQVPGGRSGGQEPGHGVVVGERPGHGPSLCHPCGNIDRSVLSIGCSRMSVQVDDRVVGVHAVDLAGFI